MSLKRTTKKKFHFYFWGVEGVGGLKGTSLCFKCKTGKNVHDETKTMRTVRKSLLFYVKISFCNSHAVIKLSRLVCETIDIGCNKQTAGKKNEHFSC